MELRREMLTGEAIRPHLDAIARLRIDIFKEYPYLYKGEARYEVDYLHVYARSPEAVVVLAWDGDCLAGAVTAIPMRDEMQEFAACFAHGVYPLHDVFYIGELLFYPPYRAKGYGSGMVAQVEEYIRGLAGYRYVTCATVVREDDHPMRGAGFVPIDRFLQRVDFCKIAGMTVCLQWPELDGVSVDHDMQFWVKPL